MVRGEKIFKTAELSSESMLPKIFSSSRYSNHIAKKNLQCSNFIFRKIVLINFFFKIGTLSVMTQPQRASQCSGTCPNQGTPLSLYAR
jgi:hypothetical protein